MAAPAAYLIFGETLQIIDGALVLAGVFLAEPECCRRSVPRAFAEVHNHALRNGSGRQEGARTRWTVLTEPGFPGTFHSQLRRWTL